MSNNLLSCNVLLRFLKVSHIQYDFKLKGVSTGIIWSRVRGRDCKRFFFFFLGKYVGVDVVGRHNLKGIRNIKLNMNESIAIILFFFELVNIPPVAPS